MTQVIDAKRRQMDKLLAQMNQERLAVIAKRDELNALIPKMTSRNFKALDIERVRGELMQLTEQLANTTKVVNTLLNAIQAAKLRKRSKKQPATLKELEKRMKRERKWNLLQRVAQEGIYSVRRIRGYHTGVICYVVMAGGTILSAHLDKQEALDNWHALLNGVSTVNNDTCEIDGV